MVTGKRLTVIQHTAAEYLGLIEDHLEGRGIGFDYHRPFAAGGKVPRVEQISAALILLGGGPWGAAGPRNLPTLVEEVELTYRCLTLGLPVIGFGLGAHILALAAGGRCLNAPLEFRVASIVRTDAAALKGFLPARYPQVIYGRDRFEPPGEARVLAKDEHDVPALFQIGQQAIGFSGHPGFKRAMAEDLIMEFDDSPDETTHALEAVSAQATAIESALMLTMTGLIQLTGLMDS